MQWYVTNLNVQSFQHKVQSKIFASQGFSKLASKYAEHAEEEVGWVSQFIDRILDLGGFVQVENAQGMAMYSDAVEFLKAEESVSAEGLKMVHEHVEAVSGDLTTYDILKAYYKDEEEDALWAENQLELIERIGLQNWLVTQL